MHHLECTKAILYKKLFKQETDPSQGCITSKPLRATGADPSLRVPHRAAGDEVAFIKDFLT